MLAQIVVLILTFVPIFLAIVLHEMAHGYVALKLGDNTAKRFGRLSLNPLRHIDWLGTIALPALLYFSNAGFIFGWAKPVPVNFAKIKSGKALFLVSIAGIATNFILAIVSAFILYLVSFISIPLLHGILEVFFMNMVVYNIVLAVFNLLPIPPMDGSKIFLGNIKNYWVERFVAAEKFGLTLFFLFAFILPMIGNLLGFDWNVFGWYITNVSKFFIELLI